MMLFAISALLSSCEKNEAIIVYELECSSNLVDKAIITVTHTDASGKKESFTIGNSEWTEGKESGKLWTKTFHHEDFSSVTDQLSVSYSTKTGVEAEKVSASVFTHNLKAKVEVWDKDRNYSERTINSDRSTNITIGEHTIADLLNSFHDYVGMRIESNGTIVKLDDNSITVNTLTTGHEEEISGSFEIFNVSTGKEVKLFDGVVVSVGKPVASCYGGDTLRIIFTPNDKYTNLRFDVTCEEMTKLTDELFVLPKGNEDKTEIVESKSIELKANYHDATISLTSQKKGKITYRPSFSFNVSYELNMSDDLLKFATPEITYTDETGKTKTVKLSDSDFTRESTTYFLYEDKNGDIHYLSSDKEPEEGWVKTEERVATNTYYSFNSRFTRRSSALEVSVHYLPKEGEELTADNCSFNRSLDWDATGYTNIAVSISIGGSGDKIKIAQEYLEKLFSTTDTMTLFIDKEGNISKKR